MKIRHSTSSGQDKIELQMTPMIDIVFQLLIFFIMTFKIVSIEGDFNIKMPLAGTSEALQSDVLIPPMKVKLAADDLGDLKSIKMNDTTSFGSFDDLQLHIVSVIGTERGPESIQATAEVELDCDYTRTAERQVRLADNMASR